MASRVPDIAAAQVEVLLSPMPAVRAEMVAGLIRTCARAVDTSSDLVVARACVEAVRVAAEHDGGASLAVPATCSVTRSTMPFCWTTRHGLSSSAA